MIVLLLNASYEPLSVCTWKRAMKLVFNDKVDVIETNGKIINGEIPLPSVIKLKKYIRVPDKRISLSKSNILHRDNYKCQYCGSEFDLTIDHIIPKSMGGKHEWTNVVTACIKCNLKKSNKSLEQSGLSLLREPEIPKFGNKFTIMKKIKSKNHNDKIWNKYI